MFATARQKCNRRECLSCVCVTHNIIGDLDGGTQRTGATERDAKKWASMLSDAHPVYLTQRAAGHARKQGNQKETAKKEQQGTNGECWTRARRE